MLVGEAVLKQRRHTTASASGGDAMQWYAVGWRQLNAAAVSGVQASRAVVRLGARSGVRVAV